MLGSAMMVNVRRIQRQAANHRPSAPVFAFFSWLLALWMRLRQGSAQVIHPFTRFPGTDREHFTPLVEQRFSLHFYPAGNPVYL
jgi:hypothetical protein